MRGGTIEKFTVVGYVLPAGPCGSAGAEVAMGYQPRQPERTPGGPGGSGDFGAAAAARAAVASAKRLPPRKGVFVRAFSMAEPVKAPEPITGRTGPRPGY